jgi:hypothetical protein
MKGRAMNIKLVQQSRPARYGIALGILLYALWRGIIGFFAVGNFDSRRLRSWRGSQ